MSRMAAIRRVAMLGAATGMVVASTSLAVAQDRPGRYTMSPVDGGFARLDTETGAMAICKPQKDAAGGQAWACQPMGDGAMNAEARNRKLESENSDLRAEVRRMEDLLGLNGDKSKAGPGTGGQRLGGLNLPSDAEVDQALSYMERMIKKFHDTMKRIEDATKDGGQKGI